MTRRGKIGHEEAHPDMRRVVRVRELELEEADAQWHAIPGLRARTRGRADLIHYSECAAWDRWGMAIPESGSPGVGSVGPVRRSPRPLPVVRVVQITDTAGKTVHFSEVTARLRW